MAKRFQPMKEFGRTNKKPKLDISINKKNPNAPSSAPPAPQSNANLWDDDEDDVILLASQMVESDNVAPRSNQTITESEITFSEFQPKVQQHSTQRPLPTGRYDKDLFSEFSDDDDDLVGVAAAAAEKEAKAYQLKEPIEEDDDFAFKKPELPSTSKPKLSDASPNLNLLTQPSTSAEARRQQTAERQIQYLMQRMEALKQENAKLNQDLGTVKDNMQVKVGEASMLRDELRRAKQQVDAFKIEKIKQTETANAESKLKIEELNKEIKTKESQLQLKNMECSVLKMRQADESRRLEMSTREPASSVANETLAAAAVAAKKPKSLEGMLSEMWVPDSNLTPNKFKKKNESLSTLLTKDAFERADEHGVPKKFNTFFQQEMENIQFILAQLQLPTQTFDKEKFIESVRKVFSEFWTYVHTLEYRYYEKVLPYHDYDFFSDESERTPGCLLLKDELYKKERGLNLRRYIAALSAVCQQSESATILILEAKHEEHPLLNIVIDAIIKIGFSEEVSAHFGIIESCAALARSLLLHLTPDCEGDKAHFDTIFSLLKYLVFTRPNPWSLYEISFSVLDCAHRSLPFLSQMCVNSARKNFEADRLKEVYRFTNDACFLEVYCGLLESSFPLYVELTETQFEIQTKLCLNHVRFVFNCITEPPHFVQSFIAAEEDYDNEGESVNRQETSKKPTSNKEEKNNQKIIIDDEAPSTSKQAAAAAKATIVEDSSTSAHSEAANSATLNSNSTASEIKCDCLVQMCLSVIPMIYLTLRQWLRMHQDIETERVGFISRIAIRLLHAMFCYDFGYEFHACLFRENEDTTKHYFYLICTWWQENATELKFTDIQMNILKKLFDCHAMPKLIIDLEKRRENITEDMEQWNKMTDQNFDTKLIDSETMIKNLRLEEDIFDPEKFCAVLNKDYLKTLKSWNDPL